VLSLVEILNNIFSFLVNWKFPIRAYLNDAVGKKYVCDKLSEIGVKPTQEMFDLYSWRNGTKVVEGTELDGVQFIPGYHIMSLEDSISQYKAMKDDSRWSQSWFPIMANGGGDFYAVDLSQSTGPSAPIIGFILDEEEQDVEYQSIYTMMLTFLECCQKGVVFCTDEGYLEMNDDEHALIARKNNPAIEFWQG